MKKVLVVEDSDSFRKETVEALKANKEFEISEATNSEEGLQCLRQNSFDLVVLDYHLPGMTGLDILRTLSEEGKSTNCPVIMLTTEVEERGSEIKKLNVVSWILKPINKARFADIVIQVMDYYKEEFQ